MADRFAAAGMAIVALDIDEARAAATAQRVRDAGGRAISLRVDVAGRASLEVAATAAEQAFGGCTVLCANVGVQQFGAIDRLTEQDWRWVLDVNVMGVIHTVNAFLPLMRKSGGHRHIVVTASSASLTPGVRMGAYTRRAAIGSMAPWPHLRWRGHGQRRGSGCVTSAGRTLAIPWRVRPQGSRLYCRGICPLRHGFILQGRRREG
jgi:NAD(P)-dependent dehydrogenase (short-subunit alcohol dehydrogenase family)